MSAASAEFPSRNPADLFYAPEQKFRIGRKTLFAFATVAALYSGLGAYLAFQKWVVMPLDGYVDAPVDVTTYQPKPPPPEPQPQAAEEPPPLAPEPPPSVAPQVVNDPLPPPLPPLPIQAPPVPPPPQIGPLAALTIPTPSLPAAPPRPVAPAVILNPDWVSRPTPFQANAAFPSRAQRLGVSGRAELVCTVQVNGAVAACTVASETPGAYGFGSAALSMAQYFKMKPRTVDGLPVEGARVRIPVDFTAGG